MARDLALERAWRRRIQGYAHSGLTIQKFCEQEGLVAHQFSWWRSELKRRDAKAKPVSNGPQNSKSNGKRAEAARFVPVRIEPSQHASIEVVLDQPPRIRVSSGFDAELLREVVRVLESG